MNKKYISLLSIIFFSYQTTSPNIFSNIGHSFGIGTAQALTVPAATNANSNIWTTIANTTEQAVNKALNHGTLHIAGTEIHNPSHIELEAAKNVTLAAQKDGQKPTLAEFQAEVIKLKESYKALLQNPWGGVTIKTEQTPLTVEEVEKLKHKNSTIADLVKKSSQSIAQHAKVAAKAAQKAHEEHAKAIKEVAHHITKKAKETAQTAAESEAVKAATNKIKEVSQGIADKAKVVTDAVKEAHESHVDAVRHAAQSTTNKAKGAAHAIQTTRFNIPIFRPMSPQCGNSIIQCE